jgi:hypothetical protein
MGDRHNYSKLKKLFEIMYKCVRLGHFADSEPSFDSFDDE